MKTWTYILESKSVALENFKKIRNLVENSIRKAIKSIQINTCKEYFSKEFKSFYELHGIHLHLTTHDTPHQNGMIDHKNQTMLEKVQCRVLAS
jgi:hypothetical protein